MDYIQFRPPTCTEAGLQDQTSFCQACQTGNEPRPPPPRHLPNPHPATETPYINEGRIPETASSGQCLTEPPAPQSSFRSYVVSGSEVTTPATARLVTGPGHRAWQL